MDALSHIAKVNSLVKDSSLDNELIQKQFKEIEDNYLGSIPTDFKRFLSIVSDLPQDVGGIFAGYEPIDLDTIVAHYKDVKNSWIFNDWFRVDEKFKTPEDGCLQLLSSLEGDVENGPMIDDIRRIVPLFYGGSGYFLCLFLNDEITTEFSVVTQDHCISSFAPSLTDHLSNLEEGLRRGVFRDEERDLLMPMAWHQRVQALSPAGLDEDKWST